MSTRAGEPQAQQQDHDTPTPKLQSGTEQTATGDAAQGDEPESPLTRIEQLLGVDIESAYCDEVIDLLAEMYRHNKGRYLKAKQLMKKYGAWREVDKAVRSKVAKENIRERAGDTDNDEPEAGEKSDTELETPPVVWVLGDAPISELLEIPLGWRLWDERLTGKHKGKPCISRKIIKKEEGMEVEAWEPVCSHPVVISRRLVVLPVNGESTEHVELAWKRRGRWQKHVVPREAAVDPNKLLALASEGFPVDFEKRGRLAKYLAAFETYNLADLPTSRYSKHLGWLGIEREPTRWGFLYGKKHIADLDTPPVEYMPGESYDNNLIEAMATRGETAEWYRAIEGVEKYPRVEIAIYAALVPVLLAPLSLPNFAVDWSCRTSRGKTTVLRLAASCWGANSEGGASLVYTWDTTRVGAERLAEQLNGLPLILDDTKKAKSWRGDSEIPQIIYVLQSGINRGRGTIGGLAKRGHWNSVLLSSGEQPLTSFDRSEGAGARVVEILGEPFDSAGVASGSFIAKLTDGIAQSYGHIGPRFVRWVIEHAEDWPQWKDRLVTTTNDLAKGLAEQHNQGVARRVAGSLAVLELTGQLVHEADLLPWQYDSPIDRGVFADADEGAHQTDQAQTALVWIHSRCQARAHMFDGRDPGYHGEMAGRWDIGDDIHIYSSVLQKWLEDGGFSPPATIRAWGDNGWLVSRSGKFVNQIRASGQRHTVYTIRQNLFDEMDAL